MNRRTFALTLMMSVAAPGIALADWVDYRPGVVKDALAAGKTVFVDYAADWCSTCAAQERVIKELRAENPAYSNAMTFVRVDWDQYANDAVTKSRSIPRRSTLLVLRGNNELGRIVAGTRKSDIKALLDLGL